MNILNTRASPSRQKRLRLRSHTSTSHPSSMASNSNPPTDDGSAIPGWSRREALKALGAAGVAGAVPWLSSSSRADDHPSAPDQPNILFIVTDDHAVGGLCGYGGRLLDTPHLDRIADGGMEFTNALSAARVARR